MCLLDETTLLMDDNYPFLFVCLKFNSICIFNLLDSVYLTMNVHRFQGEIVQFARQKATRYGISL